MLRSHPQAAASRSSAQRPLLLCCMASCVVDYTIHLLRGLYHMSGGQNSKPRGMARQGLEELAKVTRSISRGLYWSSAPADESQVPGRVYRLQAWAEVPQDHACIVLPSYTCHTCLQLLVKLVVNLSRGRKHMQLFFNLRKLVLPIAPAGEHRTPLRGCCRAWPQSHTSFENPHNIRQCGTCLQHAGQKRGKAALPMGGLHHLRACSHAASCMKAWSPCKLQSATERMRSP